MLTKQTVLYVGSLWHRDCDAFATVIGTDENAVENKLEELEVEETERLEDACDHVDMDEERANGPRECEDCDIDICSSGVFAEDNFTVSGLDQSQLDELNESGIVVI